MLYFCFFLDNLLYSDSSQFNTLIAIFIIKRLHVKPFFFGYVWAVRRYFSLCLVLYEFYLYRQRYISSPGMLAVVAQYNAGEWVPTSMTAHRWRYVLQWLLGRCRIVLAAVRVMLTGVVWFIVTCLATAGAKTLNSSPCCVSCRG